MLPLLHRDDPQPEARRRSLDADRARYRFDRSIGGLPLAHEVPKGENYSADYLVRAAKVQLMLSSARIQGSADPRLAEERDAWRAALDATADGLFGEIKARVDDVKARGAFAAPLVAASGFEDFEALLHGLPDPMARHHWPGDDFFAWQRVGGCNPLYLRAGAIDPSAFPVTEAHFARAIGDGDSLERAQSEGRLFSVDHRALEGLRTQPSFGHERYLNGPMALFVRTLAGPLAPVAIQCRPTPAEGNPILTPADGMAWRHGKVVFQTADAATQGLSEHLGMCHVFSNAVLLCTGRELPSCHPVRILLWPHFEMTLAANETMKTSVIGEGGFVDQLQGPALDVGIELAHQAQRGRSVVDNAFERDLELRGVGDAERLPDNPWRDDARPVHRALLRFVREYLALYYRSDRAVADDPELAAWRDALVDAEQGDLSDLPDATTVDGLAELITAVIFRITTYHNVINYGGYDFYAWVPNLPTARWGPIPDLNSALDERSLLDVLPPLGLAEHTLDLMLPQRQLRLNQLGQYPKGWFADPRVGEVLRRYQAALTEAEATLKRNDRARTWPFPYLRPSWTARSIHV